MTPGPSGLAGLLRNALRLVVGGAGPAGLGGGLIARAHLDMRQAERDLERFTARHRTAAMRALNEAMRNAHSATVRGVLAETGIRNRKVLSGKAEGTKKGKTGLIRWYKADPRNLEARLWVGLKRKVTLPAAGMVGPKPTLAGIARRNRRRQGARAVGQRQKLAVQVAGARAVTGHGLGASPPFWARMRNGHTSVFVRRGRERLKIDELYIPIAMAAQRIGQAETEKQFRTTFPRALARLLRI
jgi:hypothetical protein